MTREEQITFKAGSIADGCIAHGAPWKDYYKGFIEGAKWADANPSKPSLPFHIDEAAKEYSTHVSDGHHYRDLQCGFKAGAEWMAGQGVKATASVGYYNQCGLSILTEPSIKKLGFEEGDELELTLRKK